MPWVLIIIYKGILIMKLNEEFQVHSTLNPLLWDNDKLKDDVRDKIVQIVTNFEEFVEYPISIVDIQLVGSNASYNYTEHSDIDVHIIANFDAVTDETVLLKSLYDARKSAFNSKYDITIKGLEVELYVQDIMDGIMSNGIYSVCDNDWVKRPVPITDFKQYDLSKELNAWKDIVEKAINSDNKESIQDLVNTIYLIRKNSLAVDGNEFGKGNQLYKEIRSEGLLDKLKDRIVELTTDELTLEDYTSKGQLINRLSK